MFAFIRRSTSQRGNPGTGDDYCGRGWERKSLTDAGLSLLSLLHHEAGATELLFFVFPLVDPFCVKMLFEPVSFCGVGAGLLSHGVSASAVFEKNVVVPLVMRFQVEGWFDFFFGLAAVFGNRFGIFQPLVAGLLARWLVGGFDVPLNGFRLGIFQPLSSPHAPEGSVAVKMADTASTRSDLFMASSRFRPIAG